MNIQPLVSIIIPTWNRKDDLVRCLESVQKLDYKNKEVIIVDNASTDGTVSLLRELSLPVKVIRNPKNLGASLAKNQGARLSCGDFLWFLDSDTEILNNDCLRQMILILQNDPAIAMVGGDIIEEKGQRKYKLSKAARFGMGTTELKKEDDFSLVEANFITTANCLIRRDVFFQIGGFNPEYFYGGEDTDFSTRVIKKGHKAIVDYRTAVLHLLSVKQRYSGFFQQEKNRIRRYMFNENLFLFPFIPFLDIYYITRSAPSFYRQAKSRDIHESALLKTSRHKSQPRLSRINLVRIGMLYLLAFVYGYIYNIVKLPRTLHVRFKYKNNFLDMDKNPLKILEIKPC